MRSNLTHPHLAGKSIHEQNPFEKTLFEPILSSKTLCQSDPMDDEVASLCLSQSTLCSTLYNQQSSAAAGEAKVKEQQQKSATGAILGSLGGGAHVLQLQEGLARLTTRVDTQLETIHAEFRRLRGDVADVMEARALDRAESARGGMVAELEQRALVAAEEHESFQESLRELKAYARGLEDSFGRRLAEEVDARGETNKALAETIREELNSEAERIRVAVTREMRERIDSQKVLRDETQFQQQALVRLQSRVDEAFMELRADLPRLGQEMAAHKAQVDKLTELQDSCLGRLEEHDRRSTEEVATRRSSERALEEALREHVAAEMGRVAAQVADVRQSSDQVRARVDNASASISSLQERLERTIKDAAVSAENIQDSCAALQRQSRQLQQVQDDLQQHVEVSQRRLAEADADVRSKLESKCNALDETLRKWMTSTLTSQLESISSDLEALKAGEGVRETLESVIAGRLDKLDAAVQQSEAREDHMMVNFKSEIQGQRNEILDVVRQSKAEIQRWVDSSMTPRLTSLEGALRPKEPLQNKQLAHMPVMQVQAMQPFPPSHAVPPTGAMAPLGWRRN
jgi:chromosome segregation ATPase